MNTLDVLRRNFGRWRVNRKLRKDAERKLAAREKAGYIANGTAVVRPLKPLAPPVGRTPRTSMKKHRGWVNKRARRRAS